MAPQNTAPTLLVNQAFMLVSLSGGSLPTFPLRIKPTPIRIVQPAALAPSHHPHRRKALVNCPGIRVPRFLSGYHSSPRTWSHGLSVADSTESPHILRFRRLKALTALSMTRLSEILCVDRKTPYNWANGKPIGTLNERHLNAVLDVICSVQSVSGELMRRAILAPGPDGLSCADLLAEQRYLDAKNQLFEALSHAGRSTIPAPPLEHRSVTELLKANEESDEEIQPIRPSGRLPKPTQIPLKALGRRD